MAELCSKPHQKIRQERCDERFEVSVLSAVMGAVPEPFAIADKFGRIVLQNIHWSRVGAGGSLSVAIEDDDEGLMRTVGVDGSSLPDLTSAAKDLREVFTGGRRSFLLSHKIVDGCVARWLRMNVTRIHDLPGHVAIIHRDFDDLRRAEIEITRLSTELLEAQDSERRRIAHVIHDTAAQELVAAKLYLEKALNDIERSRGFYTSGVKALGHLERSLCEIRTLSYLLHPPDLDEFHFAHAVRLFLKGFAERTGIQVVFDAVARLPPMPPHAQRVLFLIIQEALTNVYRHSGSKSAVVIMRLANDMLVLEITDHGRGFPTCVIEGNLSTAHGVGIVSMRARANRYGGVLTIQSHKHGTTLRVVFPSGCLTGAEEIAS